MANGFSGTATLSSSQGMVVPASLTLSAGVATAEVEITGPTGRLTLTARSGELEGAADLTLLFPADLLAGDPTSPATAAIPAMDYLPVADTFWVDHPELGGLPLSRDVIVLSFRLDATVAEANAVLQRYEADIVGGLPGITGAVSGLLLIRTRTDSHEALDALLNALGADPVVEMAARDVALAGDWIPAASVAPEADWRWETDGTGTWGHRLIRLPEAWNLFPVLRATAPEIPVGVLDVGFEPHDDVPLTVLGETPALTHGTSAAGVIGASFDNPVGTDGVNPFALMIVRGISISEGAAASLQTRRSWGKSMFGGLTDLTDNLNLHVVSVSLGYDWKSIPLDPNTHLEAQRIAESQGLLVHRWLEILEQRPGRQAPLVFVSAGNDSKIGQDIDARFNSPFAAAGLIHGDPNVIVVEALQPDGGAQGAGRWRDATGGSNSGGHLSAPGANVGVPTRGSEYALRKGTSIATPMAAGLASYLLAIDPSLSASELRSLLVSNAVSVTGTAPRIDAFGAMFGIDALRGNDRVHRMLVDQDDGTADGNRRLDGQGSSFTETDADGDGKPGDGRVDMSDFRRWRDGYLFVSQPAGLGLDGPADHPKHDYSGNRIVDPADELVHSWLDLNGDRKVDRTSTAVVGGRINRSVTDLEVLQALFDDPHYAAVDLGSLVNSGDVVVHPAWVLSQPGVERVRSFLRRSADNVLVEERLHTGTLEGEGANQIYTLLVDPSAGANEYRARLEVEDASANVIFTDTVTFDLWLGDDRFWDPGCRFDAQGQPTGMTGRGALCVDVQIGSKSVTVISGEQTQFSATVTGASDPSVTWSAQGGGGSITGTGLYTAPSLPSPSSGSGVQPSQVPGVSVTDTVFASSLEEPLAADTAVVTVVPPPSGRAVFLTVSHCARAHVRAFGADRDDQDCSSSPGDWSEDRSSAIDTTSSTGASVSATAAVTAQSSVSVSGDRLNSVSGSIVGSASFAASGQTTGYADSSSESWTDFEVVGGDVSFVLLATTSVSGSWDTWVELNGPNGSYGFSARSPTVPPGSVDERGVLPPGEYSLGVYWANRDQSCQDCSIQAQATVTYSLTLGGS